MSAISPINAVPVTARVLPVEVRQARARRLLDEVANMITRLEVADMNAAQAMHDFSVPLREAKARYVAFNELAETLRRGIHERMEMCHDLLTRGAL